MTREARGGRAAAVFHDPDRRRWRALTRVVHPVLLALSIVMGVLAVSIAVDPVLPRLGLPSVSRTETRGLTAIVSRRTRHAAGYRATRARLLSEISERKARADRQHTAAIGFYVDWDDASYESLRANINAITELMPEWLHVANGRLTQDDPSAEAKVRALVATRRPGLPLVPLVNDFDQAKQAWDGAGMAATLASPSARTRLIDGLESYVRGNGSRGIDIDFENLPASSRDDLTAFLRELYDRFHPLGLEVSASLPLSDPAYDEAALARSADFLVFMAYDEHAASTPPGPVASQQWVISELKRVTKLVPASKTVVALGSYGYDWAGKGGGAPVTFEQALATAKAARAHPAMDPASLNPTFAYADAARVRHEVWLLDAVTAFNQVAEGSSFGLRGYAIWRLGAEDPTLWRVIRHRDTLGARVAESLRMLDQNDSVAYDGDGEVIRVTELPSNGMRRVAYDRGAGLISDEAVTSYASPYVVRRWGGGADKRIALTFDDGPDPKWTPRILDILGRYHVPATFFIVGENGEANVPLLRRELAEGHEIGNHTFTHPDISVIPPEELKLQVDATERLFESQLGIKSVLFRPPYGEDVTPDTPARARPLVFTSDMGYYTIGMRIDPDDWARPGVDRIVARTLDQARSGGHVVLLHDAGGDRSQTVAALPALIEGLRSRGYTLVPVSGLVGVRRSAVMPPLSRGDMLVATLDALGFDLLAQAGSVMGWIFTVGVVLAALRLLLVGGLAVFERASRRSVAPPEGYAPQVSVIVPAFDEEAVIRSSVERLLCSDYPDFEVIVVDDGSSDGTYAVATAAFAEDPRVRVETKPNGGKAAALEYGIERAGGDIVVALDADTAFMPDTIRLLVRHFADPDVVAVAGNARVGNRVNLLTVWQALEYITTQNLDRRAFDVLNCISVVPGAVGAWRRDAVVAAGGFEGDTLAEDADLTLKLLRNGGRVRYEPAAVALTEAPDTVRGLLTQRFRWVFGTMQAFWKHRAEAFRPSAGALGLIAYPNVLLFQVFFPLVSPLMDLAALMALLAIGLGWLQDPGAFDLAGVYGVLFYWAVFVVVDLAAAAIAFLLETGEDVRLLPWLVIQRFFYRQLMYFVVVRSVLAVIKGSLVGWRKIDRKATVEASLPAPGEPGNGGAIGEGDGVRAAR